MSNEQINAFRRKRKVKAITTLGGHCVYCGSTDGLEFDHKEPTNKIFNISRIWTARKEIFEAELQKCQLLCRSCHSKKTSVERRAKIRDGTRTAYVKLKCRCKPCVKANYIYQKARRNYNEI